MIAFGIALGCIAAGGAFVLLWEIWSALYRIDESANRTAVAVERIADSAEEFIDRKRRGA